MNLQEIVGIKFKENKNFTRQKPNWIYQQYIKLFQTVTQDKYLIVDSDVIINKRIEIVKPTFFLGRDQYNKEYFFHLKELLGLNRIYNHSFINEIMLIDRDVIRDILKNFNNDYNNFIDKSISKLNNSSFLSEYELYGNYTMYKFPDKYEIIKLKTELNGKNSFWSKSDIENLIERNKNSDYDIISLHSWI